MVEVAALHTVLTRERHFSGLPRNESRWPGRRSPGWFNLRALNGSSAWQSGTQSLEYFVRCNRRFVNPYSYSIKNSIGNRWDYWIQGTLTCFFATIRTFTVGNFDQNGLDFWRIQGCGKLIIQKRWYFMASFTDDLL